MLMSNPEIDGPAISGGGVYPFPEGRVDWPLEGGFHCWVDSKPVEKEHFDINPFVGVHVVPTEKCWTALKAGKYPGKYSRTVATYALNMGELTPDEQILCFTRHTDVDTEVARLVRLYSSAGVTGLGYSTVGRWHRKLTNRPRDSIMTALA
jgi:hypothetical protein